MTLDQIFMVLARSNILRSGSERVSQMDQTEVFASVNEDGTINGRAADGTPIKGRIGGKSKVQMIREELEKQRILESKKNKEESEDKKKQSRRNRRQS